MSGAAAPPEPRGMGVALRLFLTCWIVFALHFATNIAREHYPAMALADHGTLRVDEYEGLHSDVFRHTDGHCYINNQVAASVVGAVPLVVARPLLDSLHERGKRAAAQGAPSSGGEYDTEYPMRRAFFAEVARRGLVLKLGAVAALTAVLVMAPVAALLAVLMFRTLEGRGVPRPRALWCTLLFAFGTPVLYRCAILNHNTLLAVCAFGSFLAVWGKGRMFLGGLLAGACVAFDYSGAVPAACLGIYAIVAAHDGEGWRAAPVRVLRWAAGAAIPVGFLLWSQWWMFGNAFLPAQHWMPDQNEFVLRGARGFAAPDVALFFANLVDLDWGLYAFAPVLALGLLPAGRRDDLVLPRRERRFAAAYVAAFLLFCACNQFGWLTWNTGFRYLMPLVPFVFLQASDHLVRMRTGVLAALTAASVAHSWVLAMFRYTPPSRGDTKAVPGSWERLFEEGVQFPWLRVLRSTPSIRHAALESPLLPWAILGAVAVVLWLLWRGAGPALRGYRPAPSASDR